MQSCSGQIFYLPVSIQCILFPSSFYVPLPLLMKWQREWLTAESRLLPPAPTLLQWQARTHTRAPAHPTAQENSNSSFMFHVSGAVRKSPISMTRAWRIRLKNCHSSAIVSAPWFRRTLKSEGKEQSTGLGRRNMGQMEGSGENRGTFKWSWMIEDLSIPIYKVWWWGWAAPTPEYYITIRSEKQDRQAQTQILKQKYKVRWSRGNPPPWRSDSTRSTDWGINNHVSFKLNSMPRGNIHRLQTENTPRFIVASSINTPGLVPLFKFGF